LIHCFTADDEAEVENIQDNTSSSDDNTENGKA
jgi:hypothetical protein